MICYRRRILLLALLAWPGAAYSQTSAADRADELLAKGQREFTEARYLDAIDTLRAGYVLSPQPRFLYALGQAYRMNHQCKEAVKAYRDFIRSEPSRSQTAAAEANLRRCGEEDPASVIEPSPTPAVTSTEPARPDVRPLTDTVAVAVPPNGSRPVYKRWWPWTIMAVGLAGVGVGVGLGLGLHKSATTFPATLPQVGPNAMR